MVLPVEMLVALVLLELVRLTDVLVTVGLLVALLLV